MYNSSKIMKQCTQLKTEVSTCIGKIDKTKQMWWPTISKLGIYMFNI